MNRDPIAGGIAGAEGCAPIRCRLIAATGNAHKIREIGEILGAAFAIEGLAAFPAVTAVEETGATFAANAILKATAVARQLPGLIIADDSGLEVDALGGAPGVHSARYAGPAATDFRNRAKLLAELARPGMAAGPWRARFRCVIALAADGALVGTFAGAVEGAIIAAERGTGGFGYDPLFVPEGCVQTFAELAAAAKHALSHRGRALLELRAFLLAREPRAGGCR